MKHSRFWLPWVESHRVRTGGDPNKSLSDYLQEIDGRSGTNYRGILDPSPETDPRKPKTNLDEWLPDSVRDANERVGELLDDLGKDHDWPDDTRSFPLERRFGEIHSPQSIPSPGEEKTL